MAVERQKHNQTGESGFYHFYGVVEDRKDAEKKLGRVRVRIFGDHTNDLTELPTEELPWAQVILPVNVPPNTSHNLWDGTMVYGFYADGVEKQMPIIAGIMVTDGNETLDPEGIKTEGFKDQRAIKDCTTSEDDKRDAAVGVNTSPTANPEKYGESEQKKVREKKKHKTELQGESLFDYEEPADEYAAQYPFNRSSETESGHLIEYDDTPGNERINISHRTGSRVEMLKDGSIVVKSTNDAHNITNGSSFDSTTGSNNISVGGNSTEQIGGSYTLLISGGDLTVNVSGGNLNLTVNGNVNQTISGNYSSNIGGAYNINASSITMNAGTINLN